MSAALLGLAFAAEAPSPAAKLVLLKLVDCCDDEGRKIFPSVATLSRVAQCSDRTVQRVLGDFCDAGLLRRVREGGAGKGNTSHYEMDIAMLRRIAQNGWAVATGRGVDATETGAESHAESAEQAGCGNVDNSPLRVSPCHPNESDRVTLAQPLGDMMCHPTPQENPLNLRERGASAHGKEEAMPETASPVRYAGHAETAEPNVPAPALAEFLAVWPTAALDSQERMRSAWAELTTEQKRAALAAVSPYLDKAKREGRGKVCAGQTYLTERRWALLPQMQARADAAQLETVKPWSRNWWALFHIAPPSRQKMMLDFASQGRTATRAAGDIAAAKPEDLKGFPAQGEVATRWCERLMRSGFHLPKFGETQWIYLPAQAGLEEGAI